MADVRTFTLPLRDGDDPFEVTVFEPDSPVRTALFAAGAGGQPQRHRPLLQALATRGCRVIAPQFERLTKPIPTEAALLSRARRLALAVDAAAGLELPMAGIGHSIGAMMVLALAGGQAWTMAGQRLRLEARLPFDRLVLLTPPTDFFRAPGALDLVTAPVFIWAGGQDAITPPAQAEFLRDALAPRLQVELRVIEDAGHFTFMNELPPQVLDAYPDREGFLAALALDVQRCLAL